MVFVLNGWSHPYKVKPVRDYLTEYKTKYKIILNDIMNRTDFSTAQKKDSLDKELNILKNNFIKVRTAEYKSKTVTLNKAHSCTSVTSGGVRDCGYKYIDAPVAGMYTTKSLSHIQGDDKGMYISPDGTKVGIYMTVAGNHRNRGTLIAKFIYKPEFIEISAEKDQTTLFNQFTK